MHTIGIFMEDSSHNHDQLLTPFQGPLPSTGGFPCSSVGKESAYHTGDLGAIPWSRRSPREGNGNPLRYSCLENPMDRGAWRAIVHGVARVRQDLATKPPPPPPLYREVEDRAEKFKFLIMAWSFGDQGFPVGWVVKNPPANAGVSGDVGSIPELGRSPGIGNDNPLQYSCLSWIEEFSRLQSMGSQRVGYDWVHTHIPRKIFHRYREAYSKLCEEIKSNYDS